MQITPTKTGYIATSDGVHDACIKDWFSYNYWHKLDAITGSSIGRYTTWFIDPRVVVDNANAQWVLRHFYRGGFMARLSRDAYLYLGLQRSRAIAEFVLLEQLFNQGFAVPRPIAANVERSGIYYRSDIIVERIDGACDLVDRLLKDSLTDEQWQALGGVIASFHRRGVYHADLNAKNILIDAERFYLIDFDRGKICTPDHRWQHRNLQRLLRSFNKQKTLHPQLAYGDDNWQNLMLGYNSPN